jgi:uncharacterized membrane protein (UPF0127 family)
VNRRALTQALLSTGLVALTQCNRTPSEPGSSSQAVAPSSDRAKPRRCTVATPAAAPAPVAPGPDARCPVDPDGQPPEVPVSTVRFVGAAQAPVIKAETMLTEGHRERGLMFRRELPEARGMLFVFEDNQERSFWMHNTCLPLDMLFIADDGYIAGIVENVPTMNDDPRGVPCRARYVLEVNAGFCRKFGVKAGQSIKIEG